MTNTISFSAFVRDRFGALTAGKHPARDGACYLEARNAYCGRKWSATPVDRPDVRAINDAYTDDARRTAAMLRLDAALNWWPDHPKRRARFARRLTLATVREIVAELPGLQDDTARKCRNARTVAEAKDAARDVNSAYFGADVAAAANAAAFTACDAAYTTAAGTNGTADTRHAMLDRAVDIWVRCAEESEKKDDEE